MGFKDARIGQTREEVEAEGSTQVVEEPKGRSEVLGQVQDGEVRREAKGTQEARLAKEAEWRPLGRSVRVDQQAALHQPLSSALEVCLLICQKHG